MASLDDATPNLAKIRFDVSRGLPAHQAELDRARVWDDYYRGESAKYIPFRPAEDSLSWITRPKRISYITRQAVDTLSAHLYNPGPVRSLANSPEADSWYSRVAQDVLLDAILAEADRLSTLSGVCALQPYATGDGRRPIGLHVYPKQDFVTWCEPCDPTNPVAVCTVTRSGTKKRYRLWTASHYYTYYGPQDSEASSPRRVAQYAEQESGAHGYGLVPFAFIHHSLPTRGFDTPGLGEPLEAINRALNVDESNLAHWVHLYARPLGFARGVGPDWRPKVIPGGFSALPAVVGSTETPPLLPEVEYLQADLKISEIKAYIRASAESALRELGVPCSTAYDQSGEGGASARSGLSIVAEQAPLLTRAKQRQPLFAHFETTLARVICAVGAAPLPDGGYADGTPVAQLLEVARDPQLRLRWPEVTLDLPGDARDQADAFELSHGLSTQIELLKKRRGYATDAEALAEYQRLAEQRAAMARIDAAAAAAKRVDADPAGSVADQDGAGEGQDALGGSVSRGHGDAAVAPEAPGNHLTVTRGVGVREQDLVRRLFAPAQGTEE